jgi:hypothetical protein
MAFRARNLSVLAYANGFTLWHYISEDGAAAAAAPSYFAPARDVLRPGDLIIANLAVDDAPTTTLLTVTPDLQATRVAPVDPGGTDTAR